MREQGRYEGTPMLPVWRTKGGLETPLIGRTFRENTRLNFAPPRWYDALVVACFGFGIYCGLTLIGMAAIPGLDAQMFEMPLWVLAIGVTLAGVWAALSNERLFCDLRAKTYTRFEGQGIGKRVTRGSLNELYGLVLMAENEMLVPSLTGRPVNYRLVLYWKGSKEPLLVLEKWKIAIPSNAPLNYASGQLVQRGAYYAGLLGVPFYDYSHVHSPGPLPIA